LRWNWILRAIEHADVFALLLFISFVSNQMPAGHLETSDLSPTTQFGHPKKNEPV
jgi:hypothetical protein